MPQFEELYISVRKAERRVYTDEEVAQLPYIHEKHPHFSEWQLRRKSSASLIKYLNKKNRPFNILEIGCGNGWLSALLSENTSFNVKGVDINSEELEQAKRVFAGRTNLEFIFSENPAVQFTGTKFDVILFAASIQYFPSVKEIVRKMFLLLKDDGEIHIIDTIFYDRNDIKSARQRTKEYYNQMGFPAAASYYNHHCIDDIKNFNTKILYDPKSWMNYFEKTRLPFYWICIRKGKKQP